MTARRAARSGAYRRRVGRRVTRSWGGDVLAEGRGAVQLHDDGGAQLDRGCAPGYAGLGKRRGEGGALTSPRARGITVPHGGQTAQRRRHAGRLVLAAGEEDVGSQSVGQKIATKGDVATYEVGGRGGSDISRGASRRERGGRTEGEDATADMDRAVGGIGRVPMDGAREVQERAESNSGSCVHDTGKELEGSSVAMAGREWTGG
ncbi:hypothetical protein C8J57DRAFT_1231954 [Mycena rebaudengoi]|nr:hypothetical protein C8J57DRAFT_1231954 [Mycena rebaudengoi]